MSEYVDAMKGIYTTSVNEKTLDEAPMAYKPLEAIIDVIAGTVDIVSILKPVYNFKSSTNWEFCPLRASPNLWGTQGG